MLSSRLSQGPCLPQEKSASNIRKAVWRSSLLVSTIKPPPSSTACCCHGNQRVWWWVVDRQLLEVGCWSHWCVKVVYHSSMTPAAYQFAVMKLGHQLYWCHPHRAEYKLQSELIFAEHLLCAKGFTYLILITALWGKPFYYPHFINGHNRVFESC